MPVYRKRNKDCKYYVEASLTTMGWKVNSTIQEKLGENECTVIYSQFDNNIDTTESYYDAVWIKIIFDINDNNQIPSVISTIVSNVTKDVESSGAPYCTSFYFGKAQVYPGGTTNRVELNAKYMFELDWVDNDV